MVNSMHPLIVYGHSRLPDQQSIREVFRGRPSCCGGTVDRSWSQHQSERITMSYPVFWAVDQGMASVVAILLAGADISAENNKGMTAK